MTTLPRFNCYTPHTSKNYGLNSLCFEVGGREFYFSYQTLIAFRGINGRLVLRANAWGPTTGKHLNAIDRTATRVSAEEFETLYREEMSL